MKHEPGFSKNGVQLKAETWYLAKRDKDSELRAWYYKTAFICDDKPKLLRSPPPACHGTFKTKVLFGTLLLHMIMTMISPWSGN